MSGETPARPARVALFPSGELGIVWEDGSENFFAGHALRCACPCASCVDEMSGRKVLRDEAVATDVKPLAVHPVGQYAISIHWSDGHDTGIYTYTYLRELG